MKMNVFPVFPGGQLRGGHGRERFFEGLELVQPYQGAEPGKIVNTKIKKN